MTYADTSEGGITVTTWRRDENGDQVWRARKDGDTFVEFVADRDADVVDLFQLAEQAFTKNAKCWFCWEDGTRECTCHAGSGVCNAICREKSICKPQHLVV